MGERFLKLGKAGERDPLILLIAAAVLLAPSLFLGNLLSHSSPHNVTWAAQFSDQFRAGIPYPRWLPDSFDGLGSVPFIHAGNWLEKAELPAHLAIIGGGYIGLEMAQFYRRMGSRVTVIEESGQVAGRDDRLGQGPLLSHPRAEHA